MKKGLWSLVSILMLLSLVLSACGPAAPSAPSTPSAPSAPSAPSTPSAPSAPSTPTAEKPQQEAVSSETPKYGGTLTYVLNGDILNFDPSKSSSAATLFTLTNDSLFSQSWAKGPAGTGEDDYSDAMVDPNLLEGNVAERWEMPQLGTFVYTIRQGVRYGLNPNSEASRLVNGRQLTADDVVYSIQREINEPLSPPRLAIPESMKSASVEKTGQWQVTIKAPVDTWRAGFYWLWGSRLYVPEVIQKYGSMADWKNSVGVGPFMLVDNIPGSSAKLVKNQNYYMTETAGPGKGNKLPYLDAMQMLIISDVSTRMAAIRTGKIDLAHSVAADDTRSLRQTTPRLITGRQRVPFPMGVSLRMDKQDLPYKDIRVRQALTMATNFDDIVNNYYKGDAVKIAWPVSPGKLTEKMYWPFDTLPQTVKDLYTYNPAKAKELLAAAGYPNGFKSRIIVQASGGVANFVDLLSIVKDQWSKVGVELEIQPRETGTFNSIQATRTFDDMILRSMPVDLNNTVYMSTLLGEGTFNPSFVRDQKVADTNAEMQKNIFINQPKVQQLFHDLVPYVMEQAWYVPIPLAFQFAVRQPWVKGYYTQGVGALGAWMNWPPHIWVDQNLKKSLGF